jgi:hypothetical protein
LHDLKTAKIVKKRAEEIVYKKVYILTRRKNPALILQIRKPKVVVCKYSTCKLIGMMHTLYLACMMMNNKE